MAAIGAFILGVGEVTAGPPGIAMVLTGLALIAVALFSSGRIR